MALPTFTSDFTTISNADATTGWLSIGGAMFGAGSDLLKEGTNAIFIEAKSIALQGATFDVGVGNEVDFTVELLYIWLNVISQGLVNTFANGGTRIRMASGIIDNNTDYNEWYVGGSDVTWIGEGWRMVVLDANRTPDVTVGSPDLTNVRHVGAACDWVATVGKAPSLNIDIMRRGTKMEITGPSHVGAADLDFNDGGAGADTIVRPAGSWITDGFEAGDAIIVSGTTNNNKEFTIVSLVALTLTLATGVLVDEQNTSGLVMALVTFQDIIDKDVTDDTEFGMISKQKAEVFEINYPLIIGDESGALDTGFVTRGDSVIFTDQPLDVTKQSLKVLEDTGKTKFIAGKSSGSGEAKVGFGGSSFGSITTDFGTDAEAIIDFADSLDTLQLYGSSFMNIDRGINFSAVTTTDKNEIKDCSFVECGQVDLNRAVARNVIFTGYSIVADAALLWNDNIDIQDSKFLANTNGTGNATAIEHPGSAGSPFTYDNLIFAGNDFDVDNSSGSAITIQNSNGSDASTSEGSGVTFQTTVTLTVTVKDEAGVVIENAQVAIYSDPEGPAETQLMNELTNASGVATESVDLAAGTDVSVRVRRATTTEPQFIPVNSPQTTTSSGLDVTITLIEDTILT